MKYFLALSFILLNFTQGVCDPPKSSIKSNYDAHQIIFYGEFLGCYELHNAYDIYGYNIVIRNYKVLKKVKGFEKIFDDSIASDILSVRHTEYKLDSNYCNSLTGKKFIIYAFKALYSRSSFPLFNNEFPSREINDNNFLVEESVIKEEIGMNELELLMQYKSRDTIDYRALKRKALGESNYHKNLISIQMDVIGEQNRKINVKKTVIIILESTLAVALFFIIILFFRKRG